MVEKLRIVFMVTVLICFEGFSANPLTTVINETKDMTSEPRNCNLTKIITRLLEGMTNRDPDATPGPDDVLRSSTESADPKRVRSLLKNMGPLFAAHPAATPQPIPIYINTYSDNSPVHVAKETNGAFSIHISTKIDFGGSASLLHVPQGSILGPLVLNNNIQFQLAESERPQPPKDDHYYQYSDDEDYYVDEGSGSHHVKTTVAPTAAETTENDSTTTMEI